MRKNLLHLLHFAVKLPDTLINDEFQDCWILFKKENLKLPILNSWQQLGDILDCLILGEVIGQEINHLLGDKHHLNYFLLKSNSTKTKIFSTFLYQEKVLILFYFSILDLPLPAFFIFGSWFTWYKAVRLKKYCFLVEEKHSNAKNSWLLTRCLTNSKHYSWLTPRIGISKSWFLTWPMIVYIAIHWGKDSCEHIN